MIISEGLKYDRKNHNLKTSYQMLNQSYKLNIT